MIFYFGIGFIVLGFGLVATQLDFASSEKVERLIAIREGGQALLLEVSQFVADRNLTQPPVKSSPQSDSFEDWKRSVEYSKQTSSLFIYKFRQRIVDITYDMRRVELISEDELRNLLWFIQPEYPSIQWTIDALEKYLSRIEAH